jgi:cytochrome c oxidase subunit III
MTSATPAATELTQHEVLPTHAAGGIGNPVLGMLLFITSEVMFFAGLFAAYFSIRAGYQELIAGQLVHIWPPTIPGSNPAEQFHLEMLPIVLPATIILVASSFTCQMGVWAIRRDDRTGFIRNFGITLVMGIVFLVMQMYDYTTLFGEGITLGSTTFGTTYFTLTGFHGAHVFGGALMLGVVVYRGMAGQFSSKHHDMVEATSLYWHFVDVVWILLFSILYLLPGVPLP